MAMDADREWREIAAEQGARVLHLQVALCILRAWGGAGEPRAAGVLGVVHGWIDGGMEGPVPWPEDPAFRAWAARQGLGEVGGHIGPWLSAAPASTKSH